MKQVFTSYVWLLIYTRLLIVTIKVLPHQAKVYIVIFKLLLIIMLAERITTIVILFAIIKNAEEISNETFSQEATSHSKISFDQVIRPCCAVGDHSFTLLDSALNSSSNNTIIKIIELNVLLQSKISLENLENISIIGHGAPTVNCNRIGAIKFFSCNNVLITGINWENCGSSNESSYPGLSFYKSYNVTIQNCSFYSSMGQVLLFSEALGNSVINNCKFAHNSQHRSHGAAVHYTTKATNLTTTKLVIDRCNFSFNGAAKSIVYIGSSGNRQFSCLQYSTFIGNKGVPVYISHQKLNITGNVLFKQNTGILGGGLFSIGSIVTFENKSNVIFYNNLAMNGGGAMFVNNSKINFGEYSIIEFVKNFAKLFGGALYSINNPAVLFDGNVTVTFQGDKANASGGAMYLQNGNVSFGENSKVTFNNNKAEFGGAIYSYEKCNILFDSHSTVTFYNNNAMFGGAVYGTDYSIILFDGNTTVAYERNTAITEGGAVYSN